MSSYRFCRTDDIGLLVDALNRCWAPHFPDEPPMTPAAFKRSIRDLQVWCSSCMVAFSGSDPIGVLIGAKRPSATLILRVAVHPDHVRQGHGRHLLESLGSKLAILGPPRIVAEVPETLGPACAFFSARGYVQEALLTDYVLHGEEYDTRTWLPPSGGSSSAPAGTADGAARQFVIPVTVDDLTANDLLGEAHTQTCWERSVEALNARKDDLAGLAVASDEQIEAYILYTGGAAQEPAAAGPGARRRTAEIVSLRSFVEDGGARLKLLLSRLGAATFRFPKVHPADISVECLGTLGFRPAGSHRVYTARARAV
ncbi:MAG TPA: GNAT family N-acetyltransferase [Vicinamibacterales bacterium]|nr:GNAT family N-acetyltransferase [Vicinamibacterales bacterium]